MTDNPAPAPAPAVHAPATFYEKAAWVMMSAGLFFILYYQLLPALLAGLLVYSLVHLFARRLSGVALSHHRAKLIAISMIGIGIIGSATALVLLLLAFLKGKLGDLPTLLDKMAAVIESARERMGWQSWIPAAEDLKNVMARGLRDHARELEHVGGEVGRVFVHALAGIVIGGLAAFERRRPTAPLSSALSERVVRLADAFEKVVFAQLKISALNTAFTAIYLLGVLPLCGVELPLRKTLVLITFVLGLIPVLGNLGSNAAIVVIALGTSAPVAIASLVFLVLIHKLEYFMNAKIVGAEIHAAAWEILLAMLCFEAAFGLPGVILAPFVYAYAKKELSDRGLI
jgi:predicted PurR-regulated permease PerM